MSLRRRGQHVDITFTDLGQAMVRAYLALACAAAFGGLAATSWAAAEPLPEGLFESVLAVHFHVSLEGSAGVMNTRMPPTAAQSAGTCSGLDDDPTWIVPFAWVERDFIEEGKPRFSPPRSLADMIAVHDARVTWVLVQPDTALPKTGTLRVTVFDGQHPDDPTGNLDSRPVLAEGSARADLTPGSNRIDVPLPDRAPGWPKSADPTLQVVFDSLAGCADPSPPVAASGPELLSSLVVHADATVHLDYLHPEVAAGILLIHTAARSPWGAMDLDLGNSTLDVDGPAGPAALPLVFSTNDASHARPAEVTWMWRFRDEGAPSGTYNLTVTIWNHAHTKSDQLTGHFVIEGKTAYGIDEGGRIVEGRGTVPAPLPLLSAVFALAGATWMRRLAGRARTHS